MKAIKKTQLSLAKRVFLKYGDVGAHTATIILSVLFQKGVS